MGNKVKLNKGGKVTLDASKLSSDASRLSCSDGEQSAALFSGRHSNHLGALFPNPGVTK
jgi:hypothetical protein